MDRVRPARPRPRPRGGKEEGRIPMRPPMGPEEVERDRRERDHAIHAPLPLMHVHQAPGAVDIGDAELDAFEEPEATPVHDGETDAVRRAPHGGEDALDLRATQHDGELLDVLRACQGKDGPLASERLLIQEPQRGEGLRDAGGGKGGREVEEVGAELLLRELIWRRVVVRGESGDDADVGRDGAGGVPAEREVLREALAERGHTVLSGRRGEDEVTNRSAGQALTGHAGERRAPIRRRRIEFNARVELQSGEHIETARGAPPRPPVRSNVR